MIMIGDVTLNGKIDIDDMALIQAHTLGYITLTGNAFSAADTNDDGVVNGRDLANLNLHRLGVNIITEVIE